MQSNIIRGDTLQSQVYKYLLDKIVSGGILPGQRVVEEKIVEETGVSRSPIREAIRRLEKDGLVFVNPQGGVRVYKPTPDDFRYLYECRLCLEPTAAMFAAERINPATFGRLEDLIKEMKTLSPENSIGTIGELNTQFHRFVVEASENPYLIRMMNQLKGLITFFRNVILQIPARVVPGLNEHLNILYAIREKNGSMAKLYMEEHIKNDFHICMGAYRELN